MKRSWLLVMNPVIFHKIEVWGVEEIPAMDFLEKTGKLDAFFKEVLASFMQSTYFANHVSVEQGWYVV